MCKLPSFFLINVILLYKNDAVRFVIFLTQVDDITLFRGIAKEHDKQFHVQSLLGGTHTRILMHALHVLLNEFVQLLLL